MAQTTRYVRRLPCRQSHAGRLDSALPNSGEATDATVGALLDQLASDVASQAWNHFLAQFSPLILHIARQYEFDRDRAMECFLYACNQLSDNAFRRLRCYRAGGGAGFRTWLAAVVVNLCNDWRRRAHGRLRPVAAVAALPKLEQLVYCCIYVRGMTRRQCLHSLESRFPGLTDIRISEINARLFSMLSPRHRWNLSSRLAGLKSYNVSHRAQGEVPVLPVEDADSGPETLVALSQNYARLNQAILRLPYRQRLLLRLRYVQDLSLKEVAHVTQLKDPYCAHREIRLALAALAQEPELKRDCVN